MDDSLSTPTIHDGIYEKAVDFEQLFDGLTFEPYFVNHLDVDTTEGKERLNSMLFSRYEGDSLNVVPSCDCGTLFGGDHLGEICNICSTSCTYVSEKVLESLLWIKAPEGVERLISPMVWRILSDAFTTSGFNLLEWLTDETYTPLPKAIEKFNRQLAIYQEQYQIPRGLNSFYQNFDKIMDAVFAVKLIKDYGPDKSTLRTWIREVRDCIFTRYLPIPSKIAFVVECTGPHTFVDDKITMAFDAVHAMIAIENSAMPLSLRRKESKVIKVIKTLAEFYRDFSRNTAGSKPGVLRKHVFGGSLHFTARAVISTIPGPHAYDGMFTPWTLSTQLLSLDITNKLSRPPYNYTPNQITDLLREYALKPHPILVKIFDELIKESPYGRIPVVFQRNPSLGRGSAQLLWLDGVKIDPEDITISWSPMVFKAPNADCDGDEMNLLLVRDMYTYRRLARLEPHLYALDLNRIRSIAGYLKLPGPIVTTLSNWMYKRT